MTIKVGDRVPSGSFTVMTADGPKPMTTDELFKGKKVVLFAVPGAFTPTCHKNHLPGFVKNASTIKGKGIDTIAVTGVNDVFVMDAWKKSSGGDAIEFLADGSGNWAKAIGLDGGPDRARSRRTLAALRHGGRRRRGEDAQCRRCLRAKPTFPARIICSRVSEPILRHSGTRAKTREPGTTGSANAPPSPRRESPRSPRAPVRRHARSCRDRRGL